MFVLVDRGTGQRYVVPAKTADESTIRLLLAGSQQESLTVYTDGFRAYDPLEEDAAFDRECVIHGDGEYVNEKFTSLPARATGRCCARGSRPIGASQKTSSLSIFERFSSVERYSINPVEKRSNTLSEPPSEINNVLHMSEYENSVPHNARRLTASEMRARRRC